MGEARAAGAEHVDTWKTLLPSARTRDAVVGFLRSDAPAALTRVEPEALGLAQTALKHRRLSPMVHGVSPGIARPPRCRCAG
jgi:hypothetical protein